MAGSCRRTGRTCPSSIAASSSVTASSRRCACAPPTRPSWPSTSPASGARPKASTSRFPTASRPPGGRDRRAPGRRRAGRPRRRCLRPHHGLARAVPRSRAPATRRDGRRDHRDPGLAGRPGAGRPPRARAPPRRLGGPARPGEPAGDAQDHVARRLRLRPARGTPGGRRRRALPHDRRPPVRGDDVEHLPRPARRRGRPGRARDAVAGLRDPARDDPLVAARLGRTRRSSRLRGPPDPGRPGRGRRGVPVVERRRGPAGHELRGRTDRRWPARAVDAAGAGRPRGDDPRRRGAP